VVGIDVAIESPSGGNVGIGFAIPANSARYIMDQLISNGKVTRGYLGLVPASLSYEDQKQYGEKQGALVTGVVDGAPAGKAGIRVQDVITSFDGKPVMDEAQFRDLVARTAPGTTVPVVVHRDGQDETVQVTVGKLPERETAAAPQQPEATTKTRGKLGIEIGDASDPNIRQRLNLKDQVTNGAIVAQVYPGSPAMEAGMQPGDVIIRINGKPIANAQQLSDAAANLPSGAQVPVIVRRPMPNGMETLLLTVTTE
jgi:serine protease Do